MKTFFLRAKWLVHLASILMISLIFMGKGMANPQANSLVSLWYHWLSKVTYKVLSP